MNKIMDCICIYMHTFPDKINKNNKTHFQAKHKVVLEEVPIFNASYFLLVPKLPRKKTLNANRLTRCLRTYKNTPMTERPFGLSAAVLKSA